jgi:hypothetical protein
MWHRNSCQIPIPHACCKTDLSQLFLLAKNEPCILKAFVTEKFYINRKVPTENCKYFVNRCPPASLPCPSRTASSSLSTTSSSTTLLVFKATGSPTSPSTRCAARRARRSQSPPSTRSTSQGGGCS